MKKTLLLFLLLSSIALQEISGQGFNSFCLDSSSQTWQYTIASFTNDAIYFSSGNDLIKTDYSGNVIWSRSNCYYKIVVRDESIYGIRQDTVIKMDTSGNIKWSRKFSAPINSSAFSGNIFGDIAFDGTHLFINEVQGVAVNVHYPSVIVLDTSGQIIHLSCDSVNGTGDLMAPRQCIPSLRKGAWFGFKDGSNPSFNSYLVRIDMNGDYDTTALEPYFSFYLETTIEQVIPMADSTYLVLTNAIWPGNTIQNFFTCTKMDEGGNVIWEYKYYDSTFQLDQDVRATGITSDSLNNIYIAGYIVQSTATTTNVTGIIVKLASDGNVLFTKGWTVDNMNNFHPPIQVHYLNNHIICFGDSENVLGHTYPQIIVFDTLISNPCFEADTLIHLDNIPTSIDTGTLTSRHPSLISYTPINDSIALINNNFISHTLCDPFLGKNYPSQEQSFSIFPNPSASRFTIKNKLRDTSLMEIINIFGELVYTEKLYPETDKVVNTALAPGIYLVRVSASGHYIVQKLVIDSQ